MDLRGSRSRRALLVWPAVLALPGCGFRAVYATSDAGDSPAEKGLGAIAVALIPNRSGQLLRQALQARLERESGLPKKFDLAVAYGIAGEGISIQQDTTTTRMRYIGTAQWTLFARDPARSTVTSGTARSVDGLNTFDQQYFAQDLETETLQRRLAEALAQSITLQLASYFSKFPV
jgi:LPS-assembly lipoprotein